MKKNLKKSLLLAMLVTMTAISCKKIDNVVYGDLSSTAGTPAFANATVVAIYTGLNGGYNWNGGYGSASEAWRVHDFLSTDEGASNWGGGGEILNKLAFTPDFDLSKATYNTLLPYVSRATVGISQIQSITMDEKLKTQYIAELKALRAFYSYMLFSYYGPLTIQTDPVIAANPDAPYVARPTNETMVNQILADYNDAITDLPVKQTGNSYGRFTKGAALTGLMKVYMHEKRWADAISAGEKIKTLGYSLMPNYEDNFSMAAKNGASPEVIATVVCSSAQDAHANMWLAHVLPSDYVDPSSIPVTAWDGYKMPWKTYDKFDQADKRLKVLLRNYPIGKKADGSLIYKDLRTFTGYNLGAIPVKYNAEGLKQNSQNSEVDEPIYRYSDVLLMLAEARNEANNGPDGVAYTEINMVRTRAGLPSLSGLDKANFLSKIQDERLFELWGEGVRRDDLIRWKLYVKRAQLDYPNANKPATDANVLFPIPREAVNQSGGVIKQNPGYQ